MTTTAAPSISTFTLTGTATGPFPTGWTYADPADVVATVLVEGREGPALSPVSDYLLTASDPLTGGGTVNLYGAAVPVGGWTAGSVLVLARRTARRQSLALPDTQGFKPRAMERALDRLTRIAEEDRDILGRSLLLPQGETAAALPSLDARKGRFFAWDAGGQAFAAEGAVGGLPVSPFFAEALTALDGPSAREALGATQEEILYQRDAPGSFPAPVQLKLQQQYEITDFIDRQYWAAIRNWGDVPTSVFETAWAAAKADLPTETSFFNVQCGRIRFPEGRFRFSSAIGVTGAFHIRGDGEGTEVRTTHPSNHVFDVSSYFAEIHDLRISAAVARTGGRYVRLRNGLAPRFVMSNLLAQDPHHFFICEGDADPNIHLSVIYMEDITVRDGKPGATLFQFDSGLAVSMVEVLTENSLAARPAHALRLRNCGDLNIRDCQFIGADVDVLIDPGPGQEVNSLTSSGTYYDNPGYAGIHLKAAGGKINGAVFRGDWTSSASTGYGVKAETSGGGSINGLAIVDHQSHLNAQDGFNLSGAITKAKISGWAAQNAGTGVALVGALDGVDMDVVCGPWRGLNGNGVGVYIDAGNNHYRVRGDLRGNLTTNIINGAPAAASKEVSAWLS